MHVPGVNNVTELPDTVQTGVVVDENDTGRPDDAVALTDTGDCDNVALAGAVNVIVCAFFDTVKLCCTGAAGSKSTLPG